MIQLSIILMIAGISVIKFLTINIEKLIKDENKILFIKNFYFLFPIIFSFFFALFFKIFKESNFIINFIYYCGFMLLIYHSLFKLIIKKIKKIIKDKNIEL